MATVPHPDLPTILRALTLVTWWLLSWKSWSFGNAAARGAGGAAFWSPLLQSRASSWPAGASFLGTGSFTGAAPAGRGGGGQWAG